MIRVCVPNVLKIFPFMKNISSVMSDQCEIPESGLAYIDVKENCNPFDLFNSWLKDAKLYGKMKTVVFNVATSNKIGDVANRTLVLRELKDNNFVFKTNGDSTKIEHIKENPKVAACFHWSYSKNEKNIVQQVRVEGIAEQLTSEECEKHYKNEPLFCQIRSHICQQGKKVEWDQLKKQHDELYQKVKCSNEELKMPENEVAYRIVPRSLDFYFTWNNNIADRLKFTRKCGDEWTFDRIAT